MTGERKHQAHAANLEQQVDQELTRKVEVTAEPARSGRAARTTFAPGELVAGRFLVTRFIAAGGMGEVYEAEDLELEDRVALKTVRPDVAEDDTVMERFRREVQLARKVTHSSVCRIHDVFRHARAASDERLASEVTFVSMELLEGETLRQRIRRLGRLDTNAALDFAEQIADALTTAHDQGIIHRDLKSSNVVVVAGQERERAVVTDFGLARLRGGSAAGVGDLTSTGMIMGTPGYMAPEQATGGEITPAADVYALGVVMYEMVTGHLPFEGDSALAITVRRLSENPPSPRVHVPDLEQRWEEVILHCLQRDPAARPGSPREVIESLAIARTIGDRRQIASLLNNLGFLLHQRGELAEAELHAGRPAEARTRAREALTTLTEDDQPADEARARTLLAQALIATGETGAALEEIERAAEIVHEPEDGELAGEIGVVAARLRALDHPDEARDSLAGIAAEAARSGQWNVFFEARLAGAEIEISRGRDDQARRHLEEVVAEAQSHSYPGSARRAQRLLQSIDDAGQRSSNGG